MLQEKYLTVEALTKYIERKFEADPYLKQVFVKGEISNLKTPASGHIYFTLKDEAAMLRSVMFAKSVAKLPFQPEDGMNVLVTGRVSVFNKAGRYQFYVDSMEPDGVGALYVQFEQLKAKLDKEGLFDAAHKKVLPSFPSKIAVVTSATGAAVRDILTTIHRRMPSVEVLVFPTLVQGETAARKIAENIARINARNDIDLMIIGRGGGSLEELWAFNEEIVVRSVFDSDVPIISAVGHETDFSLADFAADVRAATPTAAAELAVPHYQDLNERLLERKYRLTNLMRQTLERSEVNLRAKRERLLLRGPRKLLDEQTERLDYFSGRMQNAFSRVIWQQETRLTQFSNRLQLVLPERLVADAKRDTKELAGRLQVATTDIIKLKRYEFEKHISALELLSPLSLLKRGYGVTYKAGKVVKEVRELSAGDEVKVVLSDGAFLANVMSKEEEK
ncbi:MULTISPECIES: exodeoxyribonuclease VII large subunit [unclassified Listeria]|uniref:exodeoxyribonuclease VII large subunit n=1 Tax=unclassified Listeria TaxID=2642072 RepID=UPI002100EDD6|nr:MULTISPECIES: exodeoxyribonuclease VII large subunit [unclassified Listeria]